MIGMEQIRRRAKKLGFDVVGITPALPVPRLKAYERWIERGYHAEMGYMARPDRVERRQDPRKILAGARSVVVVGMNYYPGPRPEADPSRGRISNYAWGGDYHELMVPRLERLAQWIDEQIGGEASHRVYVDTGPILERAYAERAGLGFIGKNACLIHPKMGSYLFLGEILFDVDLPSTPHETVGGCGTCTLCLDACPTGALVAPHVLDARRCISYLTIEHKGWIPEELRAPMGSWIYGCDVCQAVCPWQRFARPTEEPLYRPSDRERAAPALWELIGLDETGFQERYEGTPIERTGRARLLRNVAVALGNWGDAAAIPALTRALRDEEELVRGHAAWALGRVGGERAKRALGEALKRESEDRVRVEMERALREAI